MERIWETNVKGVEEYRYSQNTSLGKDDLWLSSLGRVNVNSAPQSSPLLFTVRDPP